MQHSRKARIIDWMRQTFCLASLAFEELAETVWNHFMRKITPFIFLIIIVCSCARQVEDPMVTQMRVRNMQTRTFVGSNAKAVMKEVVAVLQDEGYIVKNVSQDLGLLTAELDTSIEKFSSKFWAYLFSGRNARWNKRTVIEMTSNVSEEEGRAKLRINFALRILDNAGCVVDLYQILDQEAYQEFFNKVQNGLMLKQPKRM